MDAEERAALKARYPDHFFCRVIKAGEEKIIAIPKSRKDEPVPSMPGLTFDMLHGATIHLSTRQQEAA